MPNRRFEFLYVAWPTRALHLFMQYSFGCSPSVYSVADNTYCEPIDDVPSYYKLLMPICTC